MRRSKDWAGFNVNIVVLYNACSSQERSDEQDTLRQSLFVEGLLKPLGHKTQVLSCDLNLSALHEQLLAIKPDLVFNFTEGLNGDGRFIHFPAAVLEILNIPFTGACSESIYKTSHKIIAKQCLELNRLFTPDWYSLKTLASVKTIPCQKWIVKSLWEHSSLGLDEFSVLETGDASKLREKIILKEQQLKTPCFAEAFIWGREFNVSLLETSNGVLVLPIAEMQFVHFGKRLPILSFQAKWDDESLESQHTQRNFVHAPEDQFILEVLSQMSLRCWELFDLSGYARVDFRVDREGKPFILEINANPCLSEDAGFMASASQKNLSHLSVIQSIIHAALK